MHIMQSAVVACLLAHRSAAGLILFTCSLVLLYSLHASFSDSDNFSELVRQIRQNLDIEWLGNVRKVVM